MSELFYMITNFLRSNRIEIVFTMSKPLDLSREYEWSCKTVGGAWYAIKKEISKSSASPTEIIKEGGGRGLRGKGIMGWELWGKGGLDG